MTRKLELSNTNRNSTAEDTMAHSSPTSTTTPPPSWGEDDTMRTTLRWNRLVKTVQVQQKNAGLMRGSIADRASSSNNNNNSSAAPTEAALKSGPVTKTILAEVSGFAAPGEVLALMGPSGSGKTSLLNCLSGRTSYSSGVFSVNGTPITQKSAAMKRLMAKVVYVKQEDIFFTHLSVRDQLLYTAFLRLPQAWSKEQKVAEVERIIKLLRLSKVKESPIFLLSGGEKKRVNIGTELLTNPSCLLLDEPTSGLDSTSAVALIKLLQSLARTQGKTVITSIHQPNSALFRSFDKLLLLAEGHVVYFGTPKNSLVYLQQQNLVCPDGYNAADHWMDLLVSDSSIEEEHDILNETTAYDNLGTTEHTNASVEQQQQQAAVQMLSTGEVNDGGAAIKPPKLHKKKSAFTIRKERNHNNNNQDGTSPASLTTRQQLIEAWDGEAVAEQLDLVVKSMAAEKSNNGSDAVTAAAAEEEEKARHKATKYSTSWWTQYKILTHRAMKNSRSAIFTPLNLIKSALLGVVCGLVWFRIEYTEATVGDINSYCFFAMTFWTFDAMFGALMAFPAERQVILKERASGSYHLGAYFMAKTTSEMPTRLILPTLFMIISWWMAGISYSFSVFFFTTLVSLLSTVAGEAIGLLIGASIYDMQKALTTVTVVSLGMMLVGGFFVEKLPVFIAWGKYLSPFTYTFNAARQVVFHQSVPCDGSGFLQDLCLSRNVGDRVPAPEVLEFLSNDGSLAFNVGMLVALGLVPRYLAYLALRSKKEAER